jgi:hypothetical protein
MGGLAMNPVDWKGWLELIGIFSILASLLIVVVQLQQEQDLLELEMRNYMVETSVAVHESIIDNADIWVRGNAGEELEPAERAAYGLLLTNMNDWYFQTAMAFGTMYPGNEDQVVSMFAGFLLENPGAYRAWIDRERRLHGYRTAVDPAETITSDWIDRIESMIAVLEAGK